MQDVRSEAVLEGYATYLQRVPDATFYHTRKDAANDPYFFETSRIYRVKINASISREDDFKLRLARAIRRFLRNNPGHDPNDMMDLT